MDSEAKFKLTKLMETEYLKQLFKDLVQTGKITEEEFWNSMTDIKQFSRKEKESNMESGVSNKRLIISNKYILDTNSAEINFEKPDAMRLLNEYPRMKQLYDLKVTEDPETEKDFWEYYLKKNYEYRTEIFGGENPIFTGTTEKDEKVYEDKYVNKDIMMAVDDDEEEIKEQAIINQKLRNIDPSVNFILNKDDELRPEGYGDFQPTMGVEAGSDEPFGKGVKTMKKMQREQEENEKILGKYNKYSERILSKNANDEFAVKDVERNKSKSKIIPLDVHMKSDATKYITNGKNKKSKQLSQEQINKNSERIKKFSQKLSEHKDKIFPFSSCYPASKDAHEYLEGVIFKAYKTTLRVNSEDIEKRIPENILQQQNFFQHKHDKLLEFFYNKFPITNKNPGDLDKVIGMKATIMKLGKEISDLMKKMNAHPEYKKYTSVYEPMKQTLIVALQKIKNIS